MENQRKQNNMLFLSFPSFLFVFASEQFGPHLRLVPVVGVRTDRVQTDTVLVLVFVVLWMV